MIFEEVDTSHMTATQIKLYDCMEVMMNDMGQYRLSSAELMGVLEVFKLHWIMDKKCSDPSNRSEVKMYNKLKDVCTEKEMTTFQVCSLIEALKAQIHGDIQKLIDNGPTGEILQNLRNLLKNKGKIIENIKNV